MITAFPRRKRADTFFHLGGDEVDETCWAKSPAVRLWMAEKGFGNDTDLVYKWFVVQVMCMFSQRVCSVYLYFVVQVDAIAVSLGRSAMRWQEVWEHFGAALPPDTVIHVWKPSPTASMGNVTSHGYRAVFSNNAVYYLDNMETHWSAFYDADPLGGVSASAEQYVLGTYPRIYVDVSPLMKCFLLLQEARRRCGERRRQLRTFLRPSFRALRRRLNASGAISQESLPQILTLSYACNRLAAF